MALPKMQMPDVFEVRAYSGDIFAVYQTVIWSTGNKKQVIRFTGTERQCRAAGRKLNKGAEKARALQQKNQVNFGIQGALPAF